MHDVPDAARVPPFRVFRGVVEHARKFQPITSVVRAAGPLELAIRRGAALTVRVAAALRQAARTASLHHRMDHSGAGYGRDKSGLAISYQDKINF